MTNEQRLDRIETELAKLRAELLPTNGRYGPYTPIDTIADIVSKGARSNVHPDGTTSITTGTGPNIIRFNDGSYRIKSIRRHDGVWFSVGDEVVIAGMDEPAIIEGITGSATEPMAHFYKDGLNFSYGLSQLTPVPKPAYDVYNNPNAEGNPIWNVRRNSDGHLFYLGETVRFKNADFVIESFLETKVTVYADLRGSQPATIPLSDLTPLTTGGMSADWAENVKEWEVVEYKEKDGAGLVDADKVGSWNIAQYDIWKVKRLSDGSTWTLGDEVRNGSGGQGPITEFNIQQGVMTVNSECFLSWRLLSRLMKAEPKPAPSVKEWEIVEFRPTPGHNLLNPYYLVADGNYSNHPQSDTGLWDVNAILYGSSPSVESGHYAIHSVRRCSDQAVWSVGQQVGKQGFQNISGTIERFTFTGDTLYAEYTDKELDLCKSFISNLTEPPRKPLFTTADGVEVFEGDTIYYFSRPMASVTKCEACDGLNWATHYSTREAAGKAYEDWLYEQPVLCLGDLTDLPEDTVLKLEQFVKDKLAKS